MSSVAIASYGAQAADPHAISRVIAHVVASTSVQPVGPDDLRKRFETLLNDRCKGKDTSKLRFVVE